jgi:hypothetical protein
LEAMKPRAPGSARSSRPPRMEAIADDIMSYDTIVRLAI